MDKNTKFSELFPSRYINADYVGDSDMVLTIRDIQWEMLGQGVEEERKPVLYFEGIDEVLVLNKTNTNTIKQVYGERVGDCIGKKIALYTTEVEYRGKTTMGVRVRLHIPQVDGEADPVEAYEEAPF